MADDKTEEPTEHKLRKAREEGQMAKSQDIAVAASTLTAVAALVGLSEDIPQRLQRIVGQALDFNSHELTNELIYQRMSAMALDALMIALPLLLAGAAGAAVGMAAQVGLQITPKALTPKFDSLNPAQGLKRVFSLRSLLTFALTLVKAIAISAVIWQVTLALLPLLAGSIYQSPRGIALIGWAAIQKLVFFGVGVLVLIAPIDYFIQRHIFLKGQRMSKDEVKREYKSQEGDPEIKGQRREMARDIVESDPREAMGQAHALIVNPTHYAVALCYRPEEIGVPLITAKGVDDAALHLRALATELGVPIFANPPLARALHQVPLGHAVPVELFEAVSVVLRWVDGLGQRSWQGQDGTGSPAGGPRP